MQRHRQFHGSQIGAEMPACHADGTNQELPDFFRQRIIIFRTDTFNIIGFFYFFQKHRIDHAFLRTRKPLLFSADQLFHQFFQKRISLGKRRQDLNRLIR